VLARLDDGEPLMIERKNEKGRVIMLGTGTHVKWTNFPLRPIFLPWITRLTFALAEVDQMQRNAVSGQALTVVLPNETQPLGIEVVRPNHETLRMKTTDCKDDQNDDRKETSGQIFRYDDTYETGVYWLRLLDAARPMQWAFSVNFDPDEPDPETIAHEELQSGFAPVPIVFAENPEDISSTFVWLREGKSLWTPFLVVVLVALVFETFLSNRLCSKNGQRVEYGQRMKNVEKAPFVV
jgi:hypothetical protein